ncbi:helix-turn-helix domain-containing protein [Nocardia sp. XZ_19_369]
MSLAEREEISRGSATGGSLRSIARRLRRARGCRCPRI